MNQQFPKMKPQFGLCKQIDGSRSLQELSLKKYKHLSKLKIIKSPNVPNSKRIQTLMKLSVSVKSLDLSQYCFLESYSRSQIKVIAKKFSQITRFSPFQNRKGSKSFLLTLIMLKKAKNLNHLCLKTVFDDFSSYGLFYLISQIKLKAIDLIPVASPQFDPIQLLDYLNYLPSSVEELSFNWWNQIKNGVKWTFSVDHLHNLQKLEFGMLLPVELLTKILKSIKDPSKLKILRFYLEKSQKERSHLSDVQTFLGKCLNLEELSLKSDLDVYPNNWSLPKLKKLSIESTEGLLRIVDFIHQQRESLENLSLTSKLWSVFPKDGFLEGLKQLKKLKKLKLNVKLEVPSINASDLAKLIEALECIEEMDVLDMSVQFSEDGFEKFCQALVKRCGTLRSLQISLNSWSLKQKNLNLLVQTLKMLSGLEHITLEDFVIQDDSFYCQLGEIICDRNLNLNEVILKENVKCGKTRVSCENLIQMLKRIIQKPTMKKLCYQETGKYESASDFQDLEALSFNNDVLKEVHHFDSLQIPSYACKPAFYSWNLSLRKWDENLS